MAIFKANYVKRGTTAKALAKATVATTSTAGERRGKNHPDAFWQ